MVRRRELADLLNDGLCLDDAFKGEFIMKYLKQKISTCLAILAMIIVLGQGVGCANDAQTGAAVGAGAGAILGGVIGHNSSRHGAEGAAIGAGIGAGLGYIFGNESDKAKAQQRRYGGGGQW